VFAAVAAGLVIVVFATRQREPDRPAAKVETPAPRTVIRDGAREIAVSEGKIAGLDGVPDGLRAAVEGALAAQKIEAPAGLTELTGKRDVLMGAPAGAQKVELLEPLGVIVEAQRPSFRWKPAAGAEYQVSVYDSQFQPVTASGWIRRAEWQPAADLRRGVRYSWQLTVRRDGNEFTAPAPPAPEARFRVLDAAAEAELNAARSASSHLVLGVAYARAGLPDEARRELQTLAEENPKAAGLAALANSVKGPVSSAAPQSR
jgi:hypothetical protein